MAAPRGVSSLGGPGFEVVDKVGHSIARYGLIEPGGAIVVAVSGGPDSTCLLDVLARMADRFDATLAVAHVDHGLQADSDEIAARLARRAAEQGFDVHVMRIADLEGPNLQARARELRYRFLDKVARDLAEQHPKGPEPRIATGHTLDDRAETTLARLVHGGGTDVLAGLRPRDLNRIRPLIELRRHETRAYCDEVGLLYEDDPANANERFERVSIRRILSRIEERFGEGAIRAIARSAERLREDADALMDQARLLYEGTVEESESGRRIDLATIQRMPRALRRRVFELMVGRVRDRAGGIDATLDALDRPLERDLRFSVTSGMEIRISRNEVEVLGGPADGDE